MDCNGEYDFRAIREAGKSGADSIYWLIIHSSTKTYEELYGDTLRVTCARG